MVGHGGDSWAAAVHLYHVSTLRMHANPIGLCLIVTCSPAIQEWNEAKQNRPTIEWFNRSKEQNRTK